MSNASRNAKVGDKVSTDFSGKITEHKILVRHEATQSQSRVMFEVWPIVPKGSGDPIDADWFEVMP